MTAKMFWTLDQAQMKCPMALQTRSPKKSNQSWSTLAKIETTIMLTPMSPKSLMNLWFHSKNFRDEDFYHIWRWRPIKSSQTGGDLNTAFSLRADPTCTISLNPACRKSLSRRLSPVVANSWIVIRVPRPQTCVDHFVVTLPSFQAFFLHVIWITLWHGFSRPPFTHAVHHHVHIIGPFLAALRQKTGLSVGQRTKQSKASNPKTWFHRNEQDSFLLTNFRSVAIFRSLAWLIHDTSSIWGTKRWKHLPQTGDWYVP